MEAPLSSQLSVLEYLHRELAGPAGEDVLLARTSADLRTAADIGRGALIVGMEGTDALCGDPAVLRKLFELGLRHVCLAHEHANEFGAASQVWEKAKMRRYDPSRNPEGHLRRWPGLPLLLDTVDDLVRLVGTSHVGIGTDFKEQPGYYPPGFANSIETPLLIRSLQERSYSAPDIDRICGENFLRLFQQVAA